VSEGDGDQVWFGAVLPEPGGVRASQIVRAHLLESELVAKSTQVGFGCFINALPKAFDVRVDRVSRCPLACFGEIAPAASPRSEELPAVALA
jgi:hypothetical protein